MKAKETRKRVNWRKAKILNPTCPSDMVRGAGRRGIIGSLVIMRAVYAINWLNIGSIFPYMAQDLGNGVTGLGTITATFYIGVGLCQVPAGILAAKWGAKKVVVIGVFTYSLCALLTAFAQDLDVVALLRLGVGAGMAFVFAPTVIIIAESFSKSEAGFSVGLLNSAFNVGGVFGLFGWGVIATELGWRPSLLASGLLGMITVVMVILAVPDKTREKFRIEAKGLSKVLLDGRLLVIGFGLLSFDVGNTLLGSFMVYYLRQTFGVDEATATIITSLIVVIPIFLALLSGRIYDRIRRPKLMMLISGVGMAVAVLVCVAGTLLAAVVGVVLGGVMTGLGFTVGFAAAREYNKGEREYETLAVSWVNGIALFGSFLPPLLFSYVAADSGYPSAWLVGGLLTLALAASVLFLKEEARVRVA